jgi:HPt (histidine-containing phosphotransfer) domain-containing protein
MQLEAMRSIDSSDAPSIAPDDRAIDLVHLSRTTMGDRALEREVLQLFDRQSSILIERMRTAAPAGVTTLAHTLKGSARGVGAWRVARAAEQLELAGASGNPTAEALDRLAAASDEARTVIAELLRTN